MNNTTCTTQLIIELYLYIQTSTEFPHRYDFMLVSVMQQLQCDMCQKILEDITNFITVGSQLYFSKNTFRFELINNHPEFQPSSINEED